MHGLYMYICVVCVWVCVCNSLVAQMVKNPPAMQETWAQSLGQEGPREKRIATHSSILAWRIQWTEEANGLHSMGRKESDTTEPLHFLSLLCVDQSDSVIHI